MILILKVFVHDENYWEDDASYAQVDISPNLARAILDKMALAAMAKRLDTRFYNVTFFDYTPELFGEGDAPEVEEIARLLGEQDYVELAEALDLDTVKVSCASLDAVTLDIEEGSARWSGYIRNTQVTWETVSIPRSLIEQIAREDQKPPCALICVNSVGHVDEVILCPDKEAAERLYAGKVKEALAEDEEYAARLAAGEDLEELYEEFLESQDTDMSHWEWQATSPARQGVRLTASDRALEVAEEELTIEKI